MALAASGAQSDAAWYADQIQPRAILKGVRRYETEAAIAKNRSCRFCDDVHSRLTQPRQDLLRSSEVKLRQFRENHKACI